MSSGRAPEGLKAVGWSSLWAVVARQELQCYNCSKCGVICTWALAGFT